jgi:hypothetical protein
MDGSHLFANLRANPPEIVFDSVLKIMVVSRSTLVDAPHLAASWLDSTGSSPTSSKPLSHGADILALDPLLRHTCLCPAIAPMVLRLTTSNNDDVVVVRRLLYCVAPVGNSRLARLKAISRHSNMLRKSQDWRKIGSWCETEGSRIGATGCRYSAFVCVRLSGTRRILIRIRHRPSGRFR